MIRSFKERRDSDEGFTLIELMVVVLIIAILLAIAIPTFLGARERANDRAAQSSLRNALTAAKTIYTDSQNYQSATDTALQLVEPSLTFVASNAPSTDFKMVSVNASVVDAWFGAALSKSNQCFQIKDVAAGTSGGTTYRKLASTATGTDCTGANALTNSGSFTATGW